MGTVQLRPPSRTIWRANSRCNGSQDNRKATNADSTFNHTDWRLPIHLDAKVGCTHCAILTRLRNSSARALAC